MSSDDRMVEVAGGALNTQFVVILNQFFFYYFHKHTVKTSQSKQIQKIKVSRVFRIGSDNGGEESETISML